MYRLTIVGKAAERNREKKVQLQRNATCRVKDILLKRKQRETLKVSVKIIPEQKYKSENLFNIYLSKR